MVTESTLPWGTSISLRKGLDKMEPCRSATLLTARRGNQRLDETVFRDKSSKSLNCHGRHFSFEVSFIGLLWLRGRREPLPDPKQGELGIVSYMESVGFPDGLLSTKMDVIQNKMYLMKPNRVGSSRRSKEDAAFMLAHIIHKHWIFCNMYTIDTKYIKKHILK
ncbi:hypothetical protein ScPMuIL_008973 [Solemya velum]